MRKSYLLLLLMATARLAVGQLYLLSATSEEEEGGPWGSAAVLFRVNSHGKVEEDATLINGHDPEDILGKQPPSKSDPGTQWIGISYEWRKLVLLTGFPEGALILVDFDQATEVKRCEATYAPGPNAFQSRLADIPGHGPSFVWAEVPEKAPPKVLGLLLGSTVSCEQSIFPLGPDDIKYVFMQSGHLGVGLDPKTRKPFQVIVGLGPGDATLVPLDYIIPPDILNGAGQFKMEVNDSTALLVSLYKPHGPHEHWLLRKSDLTWHAVVLDDAAFSRGFGRYIAFKTEGAHTSRPVSDPGHWALNSKKRWPSGSLHIFDTETGEMFSINTRYWDSQVLLIEHRTVYWRVARRLYSAPISDSGIGKPRLVADDPVILGVTYAFLKR